MQEIVQATATIEHAVNLRSTWSCHAASKAVPVRENLRSHCFNCAGTEPRDKKRLLIGFGVNKAPSLVHKRCHSRSSTPWAHFMPVGKPFMRFERYFVGLSRLISAVAVS
jgi:hypothetical protein